jgi:hypothetical protein
MSWQLGLRTTAVAAMALGAFTLGTASAQTAPVSLEIHKAECWAGVGGAIFDECHDERMAGVDFYVDYEAGGSDTLTTNGSGVAYTEFGAGGVYIQEEMAVTDDYIGVYVYCSDLTTDTVLWDGGLDPATGDGTIFWLELDDLEAGSEVVCDWYNIYEPADGGTPSNGLPSTGAGPAIGGTMPLNIMAGFGLLTLVGAVGLRRRAA